MLTDSEIAMHSTVRIECESHDGSPTSGTGFFFNLFRVGDTGIPAIVTNKHVIKGAKKGFFHISVRNSQGLPSYGDHVRFEMDDFESQWLGHPDPAVDLAILLCAPVFHEMERQGKPALKCISHRGQIYSGRQLKELLPIE